MSDQLTPDSQGKIIVFGAKQIRRIWHDEQWFFSVVDIVAALTDSDNPRNYWNMMKARELKQSEVQLSTFCVQLKLTSTDGKSYKTEAVNVESAFRIIQSIPSPKAEPFKRWLAQVGYERVQEIENPELAQQRMRKLYQDKGYPDDWVEKRVRGIAVRDELTGEWQKRGIQDQRDFAMLGEAATTEIARNKDAQGLLKNKQAAQEGGTVAGDARLQLEAKSGRKVITRDNYLTDKPKPKLPSKTE